MVWAHKNSLAPPLFIEVHVSSEDRERSGIRVLGEFILPLFMILILYFQIIPTVWYFFFLIKKYAIKSKPIVILQFDNIGNNLV